MLRVPTPKRPPPPVEHEHKHPLGTPLRVLRRYATPRSVAELAGSVASLQRTTQGSTSPTAEESAAACAEQWVWLDRELGAGAAGGPDAPDWQCLERYPPVDLGFLFWALCAGRWRAEAASLATLRGVLQRAPEMAKFSARDIARCAWAAGYLDHLPGAPPAAELLDSLAPGLRAAAAALKVRDVTSVLWAAAASRWGTEAAEETRAALAGAAVALLDRGKWSAQALANVAWAAAKLRCSAELPARAAAAAVAAADGLCRFRAKELAALVWALAAAQCSAADADPFCSIVARRVVLRPGLFSPRDAANTAWAAAKLSVRAARQLVEAFCPRAAAPGFPPGYVAAVAWAAAACGVADGQLLPLWGALPSAVPQTGAVEWTLHWLAVTLWALATAAPGGAAHLARCDPAAARMISDAPPGPDRRSVSMILWAYATAGPPSTSTCSASRPRPVRPFAMALAAADYALRCHAADDLPCWSPVDLCNTAWALAAAGGRRRSDKLASAVDGLSGAFLALPEDTRRSYLQEECLVVWAAVSVTAPRSAQHVCAVAALRAREGFQSCNGSDMAGLMWAEVLVRRGGAVVAEAASEELCSRGAGACEPSELKVIAWAIAAARTPSKGRLQALKAIAADIVQSARWVQSRSPSLRLVRGAAAWACVAGGVDPEQLAAAGALPKWDSQNPLPPAVMREAKTRPGVTPRFLSIAKAAISASKREDAIIAEVSLEKMQIPAFLRPAYRGAGGRSEERE